MFLLGSFVTLFILIVSGFLPAYGQSFDQPWPKSNWIADFNKFEQEFKKTCVADCTVNDDDEDIYYFNYLSMGVNGAYFEIENRNFSMIQVEAMMEPAITELCPAPKNLMRSRPENVHGFGIHRIAYDCTDLEFFGILSAITVPGSIMVWQVLGVSQVGPEIVAVVAENLETVGESIAIRR